mgnify:FL=1
MTYAHVMQMKPYVKHSTDTTTTQASEEEEATHHNVPCVDESERPSTPTYKQDVIELPSYTSNRDAICDGNSSYVAPTTMDQRQHQAQVTYIGFLKGGVVGSRGKTTGPNPSPNPSNYNQG